WDEEYPETCATGTRLALGTPTGGAQRGRKRQVNFPCRCTRALLWVPSVSVAQGERAKSTRKEGAWTRTNTWSMMSWIMRPEIYGFRLRAETRVGISGMAASTYRRAVTWPTAPS